MDTTKETTVTTQYHFRTKDGYKRPSVEVEYVGPNAEGIVDLLRSGDKQVEDMIVDTVHGLVSSYIKGFVDDDLDFCQETLDALVADGKISLVSIAHIPKADRNVMSKEDLETFAKDYIAVMPEVTGLSLVKIQAAASLYLERFKRASGDHEVLNIIKEQLNVFVEAADNEVIAKNERVISWAIAKLDELLSLKITADALR